MQARGDNEIEYKRSPDSINKKKDYKNSYDSKRIDNRVLASARRIKRETENYSPGIEMSLLSTRSSNFSKELLESEAWKFKATRVAARSSQLSPSILGCGRATGNCDLDMFRRTSSAKLTRIGDPFPLHSSVLCSFHHRLWTLILIFVPQADGTRINLKKVLHSRVAISTSGLLFRRFAIASASLRVINRRKEASSRFHSHFNKLYSAICCICIYVYGKNALRSHDALERKSARSRSPTNSTCLNFFAIFCFSSIEPCVR